MLANDMMPLSTCKKILNSYHHNYASYHHLLLNSGKCKWMFFAPPRRTLKHNDVISIGTYSSSQVDNITILSITISSDICWSHYLRTIHGKPLSITRDQTLWQNLRQQTAQYRLQCLRSTAFNLLFVCAELCY